MPLERSFAWRGRSLRVPSVDAKTILFLLLLSNAGAIAALILTPTIEATLPTSQMRVESGNAFMVPAPSAPLPYALPGDSLDATRRSALELLENGQPLGPPHALHDRVRTEGGGAYSHWGEHLLFSSSDNTDPRVNARTYGMRAELSLAGWFVAGWIGANVALVGIFLLAPARDGRRSRGQVLAARARRLYGGATTALADDAFGERWRGVPLAVAASGAILTVAVATGWCVFAWHVRVFDDNFSDTLLPTLWRLGDLTLVEGSIYQLVFPSLLTYFPVLFAGIHVASGWTVSGIHDGFTGLSMVAGYAGLALAALGVGRSHWSGFLVVLVLPASWLTAHVVGYSMAFWSGAGIAGYWGIAWSTLAWALWLKGGHGSPIRLLAFALAGLLFNLHSTYALILACVFSLDAVAGLVLERGESRRRLLRGCLVGGAVFGLAASPQLVSLVSNTVALGASYDEENWWKLMLFRKPFHVFIWEYEKTPWEIARLASLATTCLWVCRPHVGATTWRCLAATMAAPFLLSLAGYASVELWPSPTLASMVLSRSLFLCVAAIVVVVCSLPALTIAHEGRNPVLPATLSLLAICALGAAGDAETWASLTSWLLLAVAACGGATRARLLTVVGAGSISLLFLPAWVSLCVPPMAAIAFGAGAAERVAVAGRQRLAAAFPVALVGLLLFPVLAAGGVSRAQTVIGEARALEPPTEQWRDVVAWLSVNTPRDSLLLLPPYPQAAGDVRRSHVLDYAYLGVSVYARHALPFEYKVLRSVYGIDLESRDLASIRRDVFGGRVLCMLERGYTALLADAARLRALRDEFPRLRYVLGIAPGVTPPQWQCGPAEGPAADLPVVHGNGHYVVLDLSAPVATGVRTFASTR